MPTAPEPVRGFTLSDLPDLDAPAGAPPENKAAPPAEPEPNTFEGNENVTDDAPLVDDTKPDAPKPDNAEESDNLNAAMDRAAAAGKTAADEKKVADTKAAEDKAAADKVAAEKAEAVVVPPEKLRDADLTEELSPHLHPKTKTVINNYRGLAKTARDERDALAKEYAKEREELRAKLSDAEERAKTGAIPKQVEEENKTLREKLRVADITQDPEFETKYDKPTASNNDSILKILKEWDFGKTPDKDGKLVENPAAVKALLDKGISVKTIYPMIIALRKAAQKYETESNEGEAMAALKSADDLQYLLRENDRLFREKKEDIDRWKASYDQRIQQRELTTKQHREQRETAFREHTDRQFRADMAELAKEFSFLNRPPDPLPTDAPAVAKAKQAAIDEFNSADAKIKEGVKSFDTNVPPEKLPEVVGRLNASAIQALVLKTQVVPRLRREAAANAARIKELESELGALRGAGKLSRVMAGAANSDAPNHGRPEPTSLEDAFGAGPGR